jgi:hypothetical protein
MDREELLMEMICDFYDDKTSIINEKTLDIKAVEIQKKTGLSLERVREVMWRATGTPRRRKLAELVDGWYEPEPEPKDDGPVELHSTLDKPGPPTVKGIACTYLRQMGYKAIYPDSTLGKNMLAEALIIGYNECNCPVDLMLKTIFDEAAYLKSCTEFMAALAKTLDEYKDYKVNIDGQQDNRGMAGTAIDRDVRGDDLRPERDDGRDADDLESDAEGD